MGILNLTPDSFYDGGKYNNIDESLKYVSQMIKEGVDIIDIGACSSRPGSKEVSLKEEKKRLFPIFKKIKKHFPKTPISIDTYRYQIIEQAIEYGADMINDIFINHNREQKLQIIAKYQIPYIIMHMQGKPENMQKNITYKNFENDICMFFKRQIDVLNQKGIFNIILDPGFGFGKTLQQNYKLINMIPTIKSLGYPVLVGVSRKSMISKALECDISSTLLGTVAINTTCLMNGAKIIRVHDVKAAKETIKIVNLIKKNKINKLK